MNAEKFTQKSLEAVRTAKSMAEENRNNYITPSIFSMLSSIRTAG